MEDGKTVDYIVAEGGDNMCQTTVLLNKVLAYFSSAN